MQRVILRLLAGHEHDSRREDPVHPHIVQIASPDILLDHRLARIPAPVPLLQSFFLHVVRHMPVKSEQLVQFLFRCPDQFHGSRPSCYLSVEPNPPVR